MRFGALWVAGLLLFHGTSSVHAEDKPLWELGLGAAPINFPAYRGAKDRQTFVLPVPYVVYRSRFLKVNRQGVRGILFDSDRVDLDLSLSGALPVDSDESSAREDMPDLDPTLEIGPSLKVLLAEDEERGRKIELKLPVRAVIATDFSDVQTAGFVAHPQLDFNVSNVAGGWSFGFVLGPLFATERNHDYYYEVRRRFVTPSRREFHPDGGYSGAAAIAGTSRRFRNFWVGAFVRYDNLSGAAFDDSPLVETNHALSGGVAAVWVFAKSKRMVSVEDDDD